ncbi:universal stress protein [Microvirga tunisiensis]|uniref:Universal stress protein n=2 Tax=Pannonibacter tanglangensis TaxID=2750084 RepID=A0A7X5J8U3_9HYPH|nr:MULTISPECIES: universal stress protein [unclassified Pannonibacter]NBN64544.1 universal stress protein [Pannonibacter sp. XCT-34]NBN79079.1 universal stress protein [Pannonibacter sp. XCT-53]
MALKDILALTDLAGDQTASRYAIDLAARCDAHVTGLSLAFEPVVPAFAAAPLPADFIEASRQQALAAAQTSLAAFNELARLGGVKGEGRIADVMTGGPLEPVLRHCRLTDLIVIGQENPDRPEPMRELVIETALFESGVPVLLIPYIGAASPKLENALVAWDGSPTATRAVHAALPMLAMAKKVTVLIVNKGRKMAGEPGADMATYLARHGLNVTVDVVTNPQTSVADTLLNYVSDNGNDLVVMGGYGHSRVREFLFGGATRDILAAMTVPVLMAH